MIVDQGLLNKVWCKWYLFTHPVDFRYVQKDYATVSRRSLDAVRFEEWLWNEGASVRRKNKKCYLEFHTDNDATAFVLRNGQ